MRLATTRLRVIPKRGTLQRCVSSCKPNQERTEGNLSERKQEERGLIDKAIDNLWVKRS